MIGQLTAAVEALGGAPSEDYEALSAELPEELETLWSWRCGLVALNRAVDVLKGKVDEAMAAQLVPGEFVRFGDEVFRVPGGRTYELIYGQDLVEWLGDRLADIVNPNSIGVTAIRAVAEERGLDPVTVLETFGRYLAPKTPLKVVPLSKAPMACRALEHSQRIVVSKT